MGENDLPAWRQLVFRFGLITIAVAAISAALSWAAPFPLLADGKGGYSDLWNSITFLTSLVASAVTSFSALFGRGMHRILLFVGGLICFLAGFGGLLSNGV